MTGGTSRPATEPSYAIGTVARRTGLTPALIRIWEERYGAVSPHRSPSGHRRFSERDVRRLELLKQLVDSGRRIGLVAGLDERTLQTEVDRLGAAMPKTGLAAPYAPALEDALSALMDMDGARFREVLEQAALRLGRIEMLDGYLTPLMHRIGEACARGTLRIAHEHLATAEARGFLDGVTGAFPPTPDAPVLVIGTPVWQYHELGALLAAATARAEGWQVVYLGPNLPPDELAAAAHASGARAVGLSITVAGDPGTLDAELRTLRRMLPRDVALIVGGRAASPSGLTDSDGDVITCPSLSDLRGRLRALRSGAGLG